MSDTEGTPPPSNIPAIWADYNAQGLSNEPDDNCLYSLHKIDLERLNPVPGMKVFAYEDDIAEDGTAEIFGFVAILEPISGFNSRWRARPIESTWYRGPAPWGDRAPDKD